MDFLDVPRSGHAVQIYADVGELADSVAAYLAAGFEAGEPAILVATPEHRERFAEHLAKSGRDSQDVEEQGLLTSADAELTLAGILENGTPTPARFEHVVGSLIDRVAERWPQREIRVFGEMVDLLHHRGQIDAAVRLEELWNAAAQSRRFSLLCGYRIDVFDRSSQATALPHVCEAHSHILPAQNYARFSAAVDHALDEVLGAREAGKIYLLLAREREEGVPLAQLILMWVSTNMPSLAERILASARKHYLASPAPSTT